MLRSSSYALALTAVTLLAPSPIVAAEATRDITASIPAAGRVQLENLAGRVELRPGSGTTIEVAARVHADGGSAAATRELLDSMEIAQEGPGRWVLTYPVREHRTFVHPDGVRSWGGRSETEYRGRKVKIVHEAGVLSRGPVLYADLVVELPAGASFSLRNVSGDVSGEGLRNRLDVDTARGAVRLERIDGDLTIDTGSGDVVVRGMKGGRFLADTGSGDVRAEDLEVETLEADTGSGDVWIAGARARRILADTGSGQIDLEDVDAEVVVADTGSGDVRVTGDLASVQRIEVDTGSGDVMILGGADLSFDLDADLGSGDVRIGYRDAELRRSGREVVGARRGTGATRILVDTGSGDCLVGPLGR